MASSTEGRSRRPAGGAGTPAYGASDNVYPPAGLKDSVSGFDFWWTQNFFACGGLEEEEFDLAIFSDAEFEVVLEVATAAGKAEGFGDGQPVIGVEGGVVGVGFWGGGGFGGFHGLRWFGIPSGQRWEMALIVMGWLMERRPMVREALVDWSALL